MKDAILTALRQLTRVTRPLAMRSAGKASSNTSIVTHVGRCSGRTRDTPVVAVHNEDHFFIALPYGDRTDWMKNVVASGRATVVSHGRSYEVDQPRLVPMTEASNYFGPKERKLQRRFGVTRCLMVHQSAHSLRTRS
jgi:deazaflavin-dependent oxidoreductase (nitroreductase family)